MIENIKNTSQLKNSNKSLNTNLIKQKNIVSYLPIDGELHFKITLFSKFLYRSVKWENSLFNNFIFEKDFKYYKAIYDFIVEEQKKNGYISTKILWKKNISSENFNSLGDFGLKNVNIRHRKLEPEEIYYKKNRARKILRKTNYRILKQYFKGKSIIKITFDYETMFDEINSKYNIAIPENIIKSLKIIICTNDFFKNEYFDKNATIKSMFDYKLLLFDPHHLFILASNEGETFESQAKIKYTKMSEICKTCQSTFIKQK